MPIRVKLSIPVIFLFNILLAIHAYAAGTIEGFVYDPDGVVIEAVTITSSSEPPTAATTNASGFYTMSHPEGVYSFTASSATGFISKTINDVAISTDFTTDLDFHLLEMEVTSSYPSLGTLEQSFPIEIHGGGFDGNTRFSLLPDMGNAFREVGRFTDTDLFVVVALKLVGKIAYIVDRAGSLNPLFPDPGEPEYLGTLYIADLTNPTNPELLGSVALPGYGRDIDVSGNYAYVTYGETDITGDGGLVVVDVSNPESPQRKDSIDLSVVYGVKVQGSTAYVIDGNCQNVGVHLQGGNLRAVNVSNPDAISLTWSLDAPLPYCPLGLDISNNLAYVGDEWGGLYVIGIDSSVPATFRQPINTPEEYSAEFQRLKVVDNWLFAAIENDGFRIYNVTDPANPVLTGSGDTPGLARGIDVVGDVAYVADHVGGLAMFDIQDKNNPVLLGPIDSDGAALDVVVDGNLAYIADDWYGLQIVNVNDPQKSTMAGSIISIEGSDVLKDGNTLYITDSDGLHIIDVTTPTAPVLSSTIPFVEGGGMRMVMSADKSKMYVASYNVDLKIIDLVTEAVTDVSIPTNGENKTWAVDVDDNYIYVADGNCDLDTTTGGLTRIAKINTASQLRVPLGGCATDVVVVGQKAYVTVEDDPTGPSYDGNNDNALKIVDVNLMTVFDNSYSLLVSPLGVAVVGEYAYVADGWEEGLKIINITNPLDPQLVGKTNTFGHEAWDVKIVGNTAYIADFDDGVYVVDVTTKSNPRVVGWVDTPGFANNVEVDTSYAYVADSFAGLTIVPLPYEFSRTIDNEWKATATLPSPPIEGHFNIRAFHNTKSSDSVLEGAVTFVNPTTAADLLTTKAIIVAGGGNYAGNLIWEETKAYANKAYDNLIYQGYRHEDIIYLTDELDPLLARYGIASASNVLPATKTNLQNAITVWAYSEGSGGDLLLFMEDHGISQSFLMRGGSTPEYLTADELDFWLDGLQTALSNTVIVAYDACLSGSFINRLVPPDEKTRVVMTSSGRDQVAYFLSNNHSFSSHFWSTFSGKSGSKAQLSSAYVRAAKLMSGYQTAQLDANGNGIPNESDDFTVLQGFEGTIHAVRRQFSARNRTRPVITAVTADQAAAGSSAVLSASGVYDVDDDTITRVWAEIVPPDFHPDPDGQTVLNLPEVPLSGPDSNGLYQIQYDSFTVHGTYIIVYFAEDSSGIYSLPTVSLVTQAGGTTSSILPDNFEDDNSILTAHPITVDSPIPQNHSFHVEGDNDWVKFYGLEGTVYNIRARNPTIISDPIVTLYNSSGQIVSPPAGQSNPSNTAGSGEEESILGWTCPSNGTYYVRVTNSSTHFGANVRYKLWVYNPTALTLPELPGTASGYVTSGGTGVAGALVSASGAQPQYTNGSGGFTLFLSAGSHTITVVRSGYQSISFGVTVGSGQNVSVTPPDMNSIPQITNTPPTVIKAYEQYSFVPVVSEPDGDPYTFSISGTPGWASFNTANGSLTGMPSAADIGSHGPVTITVTDNVGASSSKVFTIEVKEGVGAGALPAIYLLLQ